MVLTSQQQAFVNSQAGKTVVGMDAQRFYNKYPEKIPSQYGPRITNLPAPASTSTSGVVMTPQGGVSTAFPANYGPRITNSPKSTTPAATGGVVMTPQGGVSTAFPTNFGQKITTSASKPNVSSAPAITGMTVAAPQVQKTSVQPQQSTAPAFTTAFANPFENINKGTQLVSSMQNQAKPIEQSSTPTLKTIGPTTSTGDSGKGINNILGSSMVISPEKVMEKANQPGFDITKLTDEEFIKYSGGVMNEIQSRVPKTSGWLNTKTQTNLSNELKAKAEDITKEGMRRRDIILGQREGIVSRVEGFNKVAEPYSKEMEPLVAQSDAFNAKVNSYEKAVKEYNKKPTQEMYTALTSLKLSLDAEGAALKVGYDKVQEKYKETDLSAVRYEQNKQDVNLLTTDYDKRLNKLNAFLGYKNEEGKVVGDMPIYMKDISTALGKTDKFNVKISEWGELFNDQWNHPEKYNTRYDSQGKIIGPDNTDKPNIIASGLAIGSLGVLKGLRNAANAVVVQPYREFSEDIKAGDWKEVGTTLIGAHGGYIGKAIYDPNEQHYGRAGKLLGFIPTSAGFNNVNWGEVGGLAEAAALASGPISKALGPTGAAIKTGFNYMVLGESVDTTSKVGNALYGPSAALAGKIFGGTAGAGLILGPEGYNQYSAVKSGEKTSEQGWSDFRTNTLANVGEITGIALGAAAVARPPVTIEKLKVPVGNSVKFKDITTVEWRGGRLEGGGIVNQPINKGIKFEPLRFTPEGGNIGYAAGMEGKGITQWGLGNVPGTVTKGINLNPTVSIGGVDYKVMNTQDGGKFIDLGRKGGVQPIEFAENNMATLGGKSYQMTYPRLEVSSSGQAQFMKDWLNRGSSYQQEFVKKVIEPGMQAQKLGYTTEGRVSQQQMKDIGMKAYETKSGISPKDTKYMWDLARKNEAIIYGSGPEAIRTYTLDPKVQVAYHGGVPGDTDIQSLMGKIQTGRFSQEGYKYLKSQGYDVSLTPTPEGGFLIQNKIKTVNPVTGAVTYNKVNAFDIHSANMLPEAGTMGAVNPTGSWGTPFTGRVTQLGNYKTFTQGQQMVSKLNSIMGISASPGQAFAVGSNIMVGPDFVKRLKDIPDATRSMWLTGQYNQGTAMGKKLKDIGFGYEKFSKANIPEGWTNVQGSAAIPKLDLSKGTAGPPSGQLFDTNSANIFGSAPSVSAASRISSMMSYTSPSVYSASPTSPSALASMSSPTFPGSPSISKYASPTSPSAPSASAYSYYYSPSVSKPSPSEPSPSTPSPSKPYNFGNGIFGLGGGGGMGFGAQALGQKKGQYGRSSLRTNPLLDLGTQFRQKMLENRNLLTYRGA
jgi:hypothetical protein